jgi:hypothetical protein
MAWLFASGHAVDFVLLVIAAELGWLVLLRGWRMSDALLRLAPGAFMLLALRAALTGLDWRWVALPLMLSFPVTSPISGGEDGRARRSVRRAPVDQLLVFRYAITSARFCGSGMPAKAIFVPGTIRCGDSRYWNSFSGDQVMPLSCWRGCRCSSGRFPPCARRRRAATARSCSRRLPPRGRSGRRRRRSCPSPRHR